MINKVLSGGVDDMLQILMRTTTGLQRGLELISGLREARMILMECRIHLEDRSLDSLERMFP